MKFFSKFFLSLVALLTACGSGDVDSVFEQPQLVAVDSTNDRLFVLEDEGILFALTASTQESIGDQPLVNDETQTDIFDLLPATPTTMTAMSDGSNSRLFITGLQANDDGDSVLNQILVLDFDGTTFTEADFSPITVGDGDDTTDNTGDLLGGLEVDEGMSRIYITNSSLSQLLVFNTDDGSQVGAAIAVTGIPNRMSLDDNRLYVANSDDDEANQVITVVNTDDLSTTQIDLDAPLDDISVVSTDSGTLLLAKQSNAQRVFVQEVDTATFAASTDIPAGDDSVSEGEINSTLGITGSVGGIVATKDSSGNFYGYVPQSDGNVVILNMATDLSSFTATENETVLRIFESLDLLVDSSGNGQFIFMTASGTGDLLFVQVGSDDLDIIF